MNLSNQLFMNYRNMNNMKKYKILKKDFVIKNGEKLYRIQSKILVMGRIIEVKPKFKITSTRIEYL